MYTHRWSLMVIICLFRMSQKVFTMMSLLNDDAVTKYSWHSIEQNVVLTALLNLLETCW